MTNNEAIDILRKPSTLHGDAIDMAIKALTDIEKIRDIVEGTIDHFDREDAMDVLYDIKRILNK